MAPLSRRQIGYVQAIAGRQQHKTFRVVNLDQVISSVTSDPRGNSFAFGDADTSCFVHNWHLHELPSVWDSRSAHNDDVLTSQDFTELNGPDVTGGTSVELRCLDIPMHALNADGSADDQSVIPSTERATPDGYLESTHVKIRWTLPTDIQKYAKKTTFVKPVASELVHLLPTHLASTDPAGQAGGSEAINITTSEWQTLIDKFWNDGTNFTPAYLETVFSELTQSAELYFYNTVNSIIRTAVQYVNPSYSGQNPLGEPHYEFRFIVFRNKLPTYRHWENDSNNLEALRNGVSFLNPSYDLFMGQSGRPRGFLGYRHNAKFDQEKDLSHPGSARYSGKFWNADTNQWLDGLYPDLYPAGENKFTVGDVMTMPLNTNDYVVMKDVRFFLGRSQGKSHFEDTLHFDWNDAIDTEKPDLLSSPTLVGKNYRWHMMLIGTSNGHDPVVLKSEIRTTTTCRSG